MKMATTLVKYLAQHGIAYDILPHAFTVTSLNIAHSAKIPASKMAKSVILEDDTGYLMAVIPANAHVKIGEVNRILHRHMGLATEEELKDLFSDCELGAIPAIGQAYGMETIVDNQLDDCHDIYIEAGNHQELIHMKGNDYRKLMKNAQHGSLCVH